MHDTKRSDYLTFHSDREQDPVYRPLEKAAKQAGLDWKKTEYEMSDKLSAFSEKVTDLQETSKGRQQLLDQFHQQYPNAKAKEIARFLKDNKIVQTITSDERDQLQKSGKQSEPAELITPGVMTFVPGDNKRYISSADNAIWMSIKPAIKGKAGKYRGMFNTEGSDFAISDAEAAVQFQKCVDDLAKVLELSDLHTAGSLIIDGYNTENNKARISVNSCLVPADDFGLYQFEGFHLDETGNKVIRFQHKDYPARKFSFTTNDHNEVIDIKVKLFRYTVDGDDGMTVANANPRKKHAFFENILETFLGTLQATYKQDDKDQNRGMSNTVIELHTPDGPKFIQDKQLRPIRISGLHRSINNTNGDAVSEPGLDLFMICLSIKAAMRNGKLGKDEKVVVWLPKVDYPEEAEAIKKLAQDTQKICELPEDKIKFLPMNESYFQSLNIAKTASTFDDTFWGSNTGFFDYFADCAIKNFYMGPFNPTASKSEHIYLYNYLTTVICHQSGRHHHGYNGKKMDADYQHLPSALQIDHFFNAQANDSWVATVTQAVTTMWRLLFKSKADLNGDYQPMSLDNYIDKQNKHLEEMVQLQGMLLSNQDRQDNKFLEKTLKDCVDKTLQCWNEMLVKNEGGGACGVVDADDGRKKMFDAAVLRIQQFTHGWFHWEPIDRENGVLWALTAERMKALVLSEIEKQKNVYPQPVLDATKQTLTDAQWFMQNRLKGGFVDDLITDCTRAYKIYLQDQAQKQAQVIATSAGRNSVFCSQPKGQEEILSESSLQSTSQPSNA